jgi:predicted cobalt transporter CbtA
MRTSLYLSMLLISLGVMIAAGLLRSLLSKRFGDWNATFLAAAAYIVVVAGVGLAFPDVNEVPEGFPADLLWNFRMASLGAQAIMWATLGFVFGVFAKRVVGEERPAYRQALA